jgi:hypothetical protein
MTNVLYFFKPCKFFLIILYLKLLCIRNLCIFAFKMRLLRVSQSQKNEKFTIIQRKFKHHHHEIAGGKRQNVWL